MRVRDFNEVHPNSIPRNTPGSFLTCSGSPHAFLFRIGLPQNIPFSCWPPRNLPSPLYENISNSQIILLFLLIWNSTLSLFPSLTNSQVPLSHSLQSLRHLFHHYFLWDIVWSLNLLTCFMVYAPLGNIRICEYPPPPPDNVTFGKMSGGLGKIPSPGPRG